MYCKWGLMMLQTDRIEKIALLWILLHEKDGLVTQGKMSLCKVAAAVSSQMMRSHLGGSWKDDVHHDRARSDCVLLPFWIYLELFCTLRKEIQFIHSIFNSDPDAISLSNEMLNYKIVELVEGAGLVAASGESSLGHWVRTLRKTETVAGSRNDKKEQQLQFLKKTV